MDPVAINVDMSVSKGIDMNKIIFSINRLWLPMLCIWVAIAQAHADDHKYEISAAAGGLNFDAVRNFEDTTVGGLGAGYRIDERWSLEGWYFEGDTEHDQLNNIDIDFNQYRFDALYHFNPAGKLQPFVALGIGEA